MVTLRMTSGDTTHLGKTPHFERTRLLRFHFFLKKTNRPCHSKQVAASYTWFEPVMINESRSMLTPCSSCNRILIVHFYFVSFFIAPFWPPAPYNDDSRIASRNVDTKWKGTQFSRTIGTSTERRTTNSLWVSISSLQLIYNDCNQSII